MNEQREAEVKEVKTFTEEEVQEIELDIDVLDTSYSYGEARSGD